MCIKLPIFWDVNTVSACKYWFQRLQWLYHQGYSVLAEWLDSLTLNTKALHFFELILFKVGTDYPRDLQSSAQLWEPQISHVREYFVQTGKTVHIIKWWPRTPWLFCTRTTVKYSRYSSNIGLVAVTFLKSRRIILTWNLQQMPIVNIQSYLKEHGPSV
jgi:hypothetical protein